ncbi:MAG: hypothetical protein IKM39_04175 [Clostridia bacterium]|nr:hypothetical protein [Clostridia bacterium]
MKKSTLFFIVTAILSVSLALYNKNRAHGPLTIAQGILAGVANRLGRSLQKLILIKSLASLGAVTLIGALCKKLSFPA